MPELPEVETTVRSLNHAVKGLRIVHVWSNYNSVFHRGKNNIKNPAYFENFKKTVAGKKIVSAERKAKNVLINLEGGITVLAHMKMTGHFLYGKYKKGPGDIWRPENENGALNDPMNRFIRTIFTLSNGKHLAFSDMRRFAKICFFPTSQKNHYQDIKNIGPDPLAKNFSVKIFSERLLLKPRGKIKQVLMDQSIIAGIGNIYSDEILWASSIHPLSAPQKIPNHNIKKAFSAMKAILNKAIQTGGDSMSDFRGLNGKKGGFQNFHKAYRKTGEPCAFPRCRGKITRLKVGGRSAHFCPKHQIYYL